MNDGDDDYDNLLTHIISGETIVKVRDRYRGDDRKLHLAIRKCICIVQ